MSRTLLTRGRRGLQGSSAITPPVYFAPPPIYSAPPRVYSTPPVYGRQVYAAPAPPPPPGAPPPPPAASQ